MSNSNDFPQVGSTVKGTVETLGDRGATVELNCGYEVYLPYAEATGVLRVGQTVTVEVLSITPGPRGGRSIRVCQV
jgi:ribosomal protein S1